MNWTWHAERTSKERVLLRDGSQWVADPPWTCTNHLYPMLESIHSLTTLNSTEEVVKGRIVWLETSSWHTVTPSRRLSTNPLTRRQSMMDAAEKHVEYILLLKLRSRISMVFLIWLTIWSIFEERNVVGTEKTSLACEADACLLEAPDCISVGLAHSSLYPTNNHTAMWRLESIGIGHLPNTFGSPSSNNDFFWIHCKREMKWW